MKSNSVRYQLKLALKNDYPDFYNRLREQIITTIGYDYFRDLQREVFEELNEENKESMEEYLRKTQK